MGPALQLTAAVLSAAGQVADQNGVSSVHATFVPKDEAGLARSAGWLVRMNFNQITTGVAA